MSLLPAIETTSGDVAPDGAVIWLHGLGADGNDFAPVVPALELPENLGIRFIFPHAPRLPVTVNGGMMMPAWYDIRELEIDRQVDLDGLLASTRSLFLLIDRELDRGIAGDRLVLAGFSQGGAVAYQAALSCRVRLGGLLAMSTYFAGSSVIEPTGVNRALPIEIHHGRFDPVVPERLGKAAADLLEERGYLPHYRTYPMEHGVCPEQLQDISAWIQAVLSTQE